MFVLVCWIYCTTYCSSLVVAGVRFGGALNPVFDQKIKKQLGTSGVRMYGILSFLRQINLVGDRPLATSLWLIHQRTAGTPSLLLHQQCLESHLYT